MRSYKTKSPHKPGSAIFGAKPDIGCYECQHGTGTMLMIK